MPSNAALMLFPSAIQRSDDLVGIVTPIRLPAVGAPEAPAAGAWSTVFSLDPQAARAVASTMLPATVARRAIFMFSPLSGRPTGDRMVREWCGNGAGKVGSASSGQAVGQPVVGLVPA